LLPGGRREREGAGSVVKAERMDTLLVTRTKGRLYDVPFMRSSAAGTRIGIAIGKRIFVTGSSGQGVFTS
jgi:hypothetical protein